MRRAVFLALALTRFACADFSPPPLQPLTEVGATVRAGATTVGAADRTFTAVYAMPRDVPGIPPAGRPVALLDAVVAMDADGDLFVADILHGRPPATYRHRKLDPQAVDLRSAHGRFVGVERFFAPERDVLATLDTGFVVEVGVGPAADRLVFRPDYDAANYPPFDGRAEVGADGFEGPTGPGGGKGADGDDGDDGADGFTGQAGKDGTAGEPGKAGSDAGPGRSGGPG
ncbi:MAG: hypothetical protein KC933_41705, partial [Myxococcales bacterium]|nr:hypothetical protein [Myxococcales bacterium]